MGALDGVRVIDFGQYIAGPLAAQLLGDQGADVVRVDPPGGPRWDAPANAAFNRGKRSIVLDLARDTDRDLARRLVASADVVVENFRPGVMDRFGLGAEALCAADPRLVYCSLPGFAADDPRAGTRAWEGVVSAASGLYRRNRTGREPGPPLYTAVPVASTYAAIQAAVAVAMALVARDRDGAGQRIEVPLFDAMFGAIGYNGLRIHDAPERGFPLGALSLTTQFECADGRWVMFHTGNKRTEAVLEAAGVGGWIAEGMLDRDRLAADPELVRELGERARALFKTRTADQWEALVADAGGECAVCRPSAEWLTHPHAVASETIVELDDPRLGRVRQPGVPARLSLTPPRIKGPASQPDADRDAILAELDDASAPRRAAGVTPAAGATSAASPSPAESGMRAARRGASATNGANGAAGADATMRAALDGVRVLDLCMVLAGPTCGRTLAEYGADVVKIQPPMRPPNDTFHLDVNRGKRDILLNLAEPEGLEVFWRLVDRADVVVQNFRKGVAEHLGVGYEQVRARRPDIIYTSINTYGQIGPFAERAGHEQIAQAATGMQERFGGDGQPRLQNYAVNDYGTGYLGAYATALALLHRRATGQGQHVDAALAYTATVLQSPFMLDFAGKTWDEPRGTDAVGAGPLHRGYAASDGWLFVGAREADLPALAGVEGMRGLDVALRGDALSAALEARFAAAPVAAWVPRLVAAGIGAHAVVVDTRELMDDPWAVAHGLSLTRAHRGAGTVTTTGPAARLSRTPVRAGAAASPVGGDAREVLAEIGLEDWVDRLPQGQGAL